MPQHNIPHSINANLPIDALCQTTLYIPEMDCVTETQLIEKQLAIHVDVRSVQCNLLQRIVVITHINGSLPSIISALNAIGFHPQLSKPIDDSLSLIHTSSKAWILLLSLLAALLAELSSWFSLPSWLVIVLSLAAIALSGIETYRKGWLAVACRTLNINVLMSIAVTGAIIIGQFPEAAMVMVLFTIAEWIEEKSLTHARKTIAELMQLSPDEVSVVRADGSSSVTLVEAIEIGSIIRVNPGERIGLDGIIISGKTSINQAPITGESLPIEKSIGDSVFAGTINLTTVIEYRTTSTATTSTLARIIYAVEEAQSKKAPMQRFVDQFAAAYTPVIFVIAIATAIIPPLFFSTAWIPWIYHALVLLVIACPCALVISTPVTVMSGLTTAVRHGILIKGGAYLESGRKLRTIAFDKTGTLTHGSPEQTNFIALDADANHVQKIAYSLAVQSDHPISQAIVHAGNLKHIIPLPVEMFTVLPGAGVSGIIDGQYYRLINDRIIHEQAQYDPVLAQQINTLKAQGKTVVLLAQEMRVCAIFAVADTVKETSRETIKQLHKQSIHTVILSGDNQQAVNHIAAQVGIDDARGELFPKDKLRVIDELSKVGAIGMIGDGINDAPALARADIGFAMGLIGTDTAIEAADVTLMDDDLRKIPAFIRLSQRTYTRLIENIVLALGIKFIFLLCMLYGWESMWMAVFADMGVSLLVVANGLRLLRYKNL